MRPMRNLMAVTLMLLIHSNTPSQVKLAYNENKTPQWHEIIDMYKELDQSYKHARLTVIGETDAGKPLHLFIISGNGSFTPERAHDADQRIILINNGIHPGESNGIDASLEFAAELLAGKNELDAFMEQTVILIIPVFNVGGTLNRSPYHRANQNGPEEHGFRGNARNLDLNRDFVKMDSRNARSLVQTIHAWDPHIFIDTHSTNGADYPYTVTIIPSHPQSLVEPQSSFMQDEMMPHLFNAMDNSPYKMFQYVNEFNKSPEFGFEGFIDYPRYLAGYATTFQILSFTIETHMLKPYHERVLSTKYLLEEFVRFTHEHGDVITENKLAAIGAIRQRKEHVVKWNNDTTMFDMLTFNGYRAKTRKSSVTGLDMIWYDQHDPWTTEIPFYNYFTPATVIEPPDYYLIPGTWHEVIERLKYSHIEMEQFKNDTSLTVESYTIENYQTTAGPYNGHYWHYDTETSREHVEIKFYAGDYIIPASQRGAYYLAHTLEPQGYDSFFSWNFFDEILARQEYFSPYLFEENAEQLLETDLELRAMFNEKKKNDPSFASNGYSQLRWIYERSPWSEPTYLRYPVYRFTGKISY
ncbi:MAG: M14 family zinc carboxypeptidase [Bacteroidales bacterium]